MFEALRYPLRGEHAEKALLAAWLCVLVHSIALPVLALVPLLGYLATVLETGDEDEPPTFLDRTVLRRGIGASVLAGVYGAIPLGMALVTFYLLAETGREPTGAGTLIVLAGSTTVLFVLATAAYLLPIALANYARSDSLRAGLKRLRPIAVHAAYFVGWSSGSILGLLGLALTSALVDLGGVLAVLGSLVGAYMTIVAVRRVARGYAVAVD
ncbi:DUF4013 domain-containing protein [Natronorarus salvus]|uniref:DUF4013 domain-containing protein n=1 Tax=Natronorarus salvus TaxID=3117733 RepID=UPI002F2684A5